MLLNLNEFSKMLGDEIEAFESKPKLSEEKSKILHSLVAAESKIMEFPGNVCNITTLKKKILMESSKKKYQRKSSERSNDTLERDSTESTASCSIGSFTEEERRESVRKDSINVIEFDEMTKHSDKKEEKLKNFHCPLLLERLESDLISRFEDLEKEYGDISYNCYLFGLFLFRKFCEKYALMGMKAEKIHSSISRKGLFLGPGEDVLTPVRLFKACFLVSYKFLEEKHELFLNSFCSIMNEDVQVLGKIELLVCLEHLKFNFGRVAQEDLKREEDFLLKLRY